jgi:hypothetical protein
MTSDEKLDFSPLITSSTRRFTGREWLESRFDAFVHSSQPGYFVLVGEPGIGKTAFAAHLVAQYGYSHHFISAHNLDWRSPLAFAHSLAAQLAEHYGDWVLGESVEGAQVTVNLDIEKVESGAMVTGMQIGNYVNSPVEEEFRRLVLRSLQRLKEKQVDPVVLVIDGLDEAVSYSYRPNIFDLVVRLVSGTNVVILLTSTPGKVLDELNQQLLSEQQAIYILQGSQTENMADCRAFVESLIHKEEALKNLFETSNIKLEEFVGQVVNRSEGNFLYLTALIDSINASQIVPPIDQLPGSIPGIYLRILSDRFGSDLNTWQDQFAPILGTLAVARSPLNEKQIATFTGLGLAQVRQSLRQLGDLLDYDPGLPASQRLFAVYHHAFANFLLDSDLAEGFWCPTEDFHRMIARKLQENYPNPALVDDDYALVNMAYHLRQAGKEFRPALYGLITPEVRLSRRIRFSSEIPFLLDLAEAITAALEDPPTLGIPELVRCGLVDASLRSQVMNIPADLIGELAQAGEWQRARDLALSCASPAEGLAAVIQGLLRRGGVQDLDTAVLLVGQIPAEGESAALVVKTFAETASVLANRKDQRADELFEKAYQLTTQIPGTDTRGRCLAQLAQLEAPYNKPTAFKIILEAEEIVLGMEEEVDQELQDYISVATMVSQTAVQADYVSRRVPMDFLGSKARALADIASKMVGFNKSRAKRLFRRAESLADRIPAEDIYLIYKEHTVEYIASRRSPEPETTPQPVRSLTEIEAALQRNEYLPPDAKGFLPRTYLNLAQALVRLDVQKAIQVCKQAERAALDAEGGFRAQVLLQLASLRRQLGQENVAIELERQAVQAAKDNIDLLTGYQTWLVEKGRLAVVSLREIVGQRAVLRKGEYYSDTALAEMALSLVKEHPEEAKILVDGIGDPSQRARGLAGLAGYCPETTEETIIQDIFNLRPGNSPEVFNYALLQAVQILAPLKANLARQLMEAISDLALKAQALLSLALTQSSESVSTDSLWEELWQMAQMGDPQGVAWAVTLARMASTFTQAGDARTAQAIDLALAAARSEPSLLQRADALRQIALAVLSKQPDQARIVLHEAEATSRKLEGLRDCGRVLSDIAAVWMRFDPAEACQLLSELHYFGRMNYLAAIAQVVPPAIERWGSDMGWQIYQAIQAGEGFFTE